VYAATQGGVQNLFNQANDPTEENNLAGVAGYEHVTLESVQRLLAECIRLTQYTHDQEQQLLYKVHIGP
jgi:hypothetical protein